MHARMPEILETTVVPSSMATDNFLYCAEGLGSGVNVCMAMLMSAQIDTTEGEMQPGPVRSANWRREPMARHE